MQLWVQAYTNYHFAGESAEWIIERVGDPDCTKWPANARLCLFADFGSSHMTRAATFAANCPWPLNYLQPGNTVRQENMVNCAVTAPQRPRVEISGMCRKKVYISTAHANTELVPRLPRRRINAVRAYGARCGKR